MSLNDYIKKQVHAQLGKNQTLEDFLLRYKAPVSSVGKYDQDLQKVSMTDGTTQDAVPLGAPTEYNQAHTLGNNKQFVPEVSRKVLSTDLSGGNIILILGQGAYSGFEIKVAGTEPFDYYYLDVMTISGAVIPEDHAFVYPYIRFSPNGNHIFVSYEITNSYNYGAEFYWGWAINWQFSIDPHWGVKIITWERLDQKHLVLDHTTLPNPDAPPRPGLPVPIPSGGNDWDALEWELEDDKILNPKDGSTTDSDQYEIRFVYVLYDTIYGPKTDIVGSWKSSKLRGSMIRHKLWENLPINYGPWTYDKPTRQWYRVVIYGAPDEHGQFSHLYLVAGTLPISTELYGNYYLPTGFPIDVMDWGNTSRKGPASNLNFRITWPKVIGNLSPAPWWFYYPLDPWLGALAVDTGLNGGVPSQYTTGVWGNGPDFLTMRWTNRATAFWLFECINGGAPTLWQNYTETRLMRSHLEMNPQGFPDLIWVPHTTRSSGYDHQWSIDWAYKFGFITSTVKTDSAVQQHIQGFGLENFSLGPLYWMNETGNYFKFTPDVVLPLQKILETTASTSEHIFLADMQISGYPDPPPSKYDMPNVWLEGWTSVIATEPEAWKSLNLYLPDDPESIQGKKWTWDPIKGSPVEVYSVTKPGLYGSYPHDFLIL